MVLSGRRPRKVGYVGGTRRGGQRLIHHPPRTYHRPYPYYRRYPSRHFGPGICAVLFIFYLLLTQMGGFSAFILLAVIVVIGFFIYQQQRQQQRISQRTTPTSRVSSSPAYRKPAQIPHPVKIQTGTTTESQYCSQCGGKLQLGDRFCVDCGTKVT